VIEDHRTPVPDQAAFRIDFPTWLGLLSNRDRRIAEELAMGQATSQVAQELGITSARISQKRQELRASWQVFQGETVGVS
jgi:FixJ family two-component response regulator